MILLEVSLRLFGYGTDLSLFSKEQLNGKTFLVMNQGVKGRYFSRVDFTPNTSPDYFQMPKPDSTFRIFCLGGSTTAGFPYGFAGSFSTYLRDRLHMIFPDKKIEVINLGMTATNSFTVLDIAKELPEYGPDLILVYDGHNEFYGALGIASHESFINSRWATLLYLRLVHLRSFQLLRSMFSHAAAAIGTTSTEQQSGTMMERLASGQYIPYRSDTYRLGLEIFRENVTELGELCRKHSIPLFLGSQVSNLRDLPPFVSVEKKNNSPSISDSLLHAGTQLTDKGLFGEALSVFEKGLKPDSTRADIQFRAARCLDTLGRKQEALARYIKARDYDMLRFRMSSDFN
ncbi:MAG: SGNH/GDSL hydrolase family protein, partial [bacterium]